MRRIVDQNGKPFKPSLLDGISCLVPKLVLAEAGKQVSNIADRARIDELRRSCGVEPEVKTLKIRRFLPYGGSDE